MQLRRASRSCGRREYADDRTRRRDRYDQSYAEHWREYAKPNRRGREERRKIARKAIRALGQGEEALEEEEATVMVLALPENDEPVRPDPAAPPVEEARASAQRIAPSVDVVVSVDARAAHGIAAGFENIADAVAGLIRSAPLASLVRTFVRDNAQQLECERERNDTLRDTLAKEQQDHAVTKNELKHAGTRTAAQQMLQVLGGVFAGYGLSELKTTRFGWALVAIGAAMVVVGCLPTISLLWWKGKP